MTVETLDPPPTKIPRHELGFSKLVWIAFTVVMVGASQYDNSGPESLPLKTIYEGGLAMERISDGRVDLHTFGFSIEPQKGWCFLRASGRNVEHALNLAHFPGHLIAKINPVEYHKWPPTFPTRTPIPQSVAAIDRRPEREMEIKTVAYRGITVDWYQTTRYVHATLRDGRIEIHGNEFRIRVLSFAKPTDEQDRQISDLCDQIVPEA